MRPTAKNPAGFAKRLKALMDGFGYNPRDIARLSGVSHQTIVNWLADRHQAGSDDEQLYAGEPPAGIMDRYAQLEGFRAMTRRLAAQLVVGGGPLESDEIQKMDEALFTALPNRSRES